MKRQDLNEHKHPDKAFIESQELFQSVFTNSPVGVYIVQDRKFRLFNPEFEKLTGYSRDELLGMDCLEPVLAEDRSVVRENAVKMLKGERLLAYEYRFVSKGGTLIWVMEKVVSGQYQGECATLGYFMDMTERRQIRDELKESEERYRDLANSLPQIVFETDEQGNITFVNRNAFDSFGYTQDDLVKGMPISQMLILENQTVASEEFQRVMSREESGPTEYTAQRKDGSTFPILVYFSPIVHENKAVGLRGIAIDMTEQKRLRQNMQFYISEITKAQEEERKRIARELHDETAQSLATMLLDIEAISRARDQLSDETIQRLEQLRARIDSTMEGVRRFSHELRPGVLDQLGLMPALELLTEELNKEGKVNTRLEVTGSEQRLSPEVELVLFRITQEALRNVRRHSQATEAVARVEFTPKKVKLNVTDNGSGFELPEVLGDFAGKGKLGLIGMHERARLLDGSFSVKSQLGKGTTVVVEVAGQLLAGVKVRRIGLS